MGFSYLGRGVSLHGCFSKAQPLLHTLDEGYLLTASPSDLDHGVTPAGPPVPRSHCSLDMGLLLSAVTPIGYEIGFHTTNKFDNYNRVKGGGGREKKRKNKSNRIYRKNQAIRIIDVFLESLLSESFPSW